MPTTPKSQVTPTRLSNAEYLRELRARASAAGLCYVCRLRTPRPGLKTCDECLGKGYAHRRAVRGRLCDNCCVELPPDRAGKSRCAKCADKNALETAARRAARVKAGVCERCGLFPPCGNSLCCVDCLDQNRDRAAARRRLAGFKPINCPHCGGLGHNIKSCARYQERVRLWAP